LDQGGGRRVAELRWFTYNGARRQLPILGPGEVPGPEWIRDIEIHIGSDGCSGVPDFYHDVCVIHDLAYRFQVDPWGNHLDQAQADANLRLGIQARSRLGIWSPMSWWRWWVLRRVGDRAWNTHRKLSGGPWSGPETRVRVPLLQRRKRRDKAS
jgi:hypothetical protein